MSLGANLQIKMNEASFPDYPTVQSYFTPQGKFQWENSTLKDADLLLAFTYIQHVFTKTEPRSSWEKVGCGEVCFREMASFVRALFSDSCQYRK